MNRDLFKAWAWLSLILLSLTVPRLLFRTPRGMADIYFWSQDVLPLVGVLLLWGFWSRFSPAPVVLREPTPSRTKLILAAAAPTLVVALWLAERLIFEGYRLSLDEHLADFDAAIFANGDLLGQVPAQWRDYTAALEPIFVIRTVDGAQWVSAYLPGNALLRALASKVALRDWVNPALAGLAVLATYGVGRQLWPGSRWPAIGAAAMMTSSAQFIIMSMTSYSMPLHLALNTVWLWLFLKDTRYSHLAAVLVGFAACGIHKVAFHLLFAGPILFKLVVERRWLLAGWYLAAYGAMAVFWFSYHDILFHVADATPVVTVQARGYLELLARIATEFSVRNILDMAMAIGRAATWQNLALFPLVVLGLRPLLQSGGVLRYLVLSILLITLVKTIFVPDQTHGWGYRYFHPYLSILALAAMGAFLQFIKPLAPERRQSAIAMMGWATAVSFLVLIPVRAAQTHAMSSGYARAYEHVRGQAADVVLVDHMTVAFDFGSFVRNDPYVREKPAIILLAGLKNDQLLSLCRRHRVKVVDGSHPTFRDVHKFNIPESVREPVRQRRQFLRDIGCAD